MDPLGRGIRSRYARGDLRLQERAASADGVPRREAIRNRVNPILALYRLSRYRATRQPTQTFSAIEGRRAQLADVPAGRR